MSALQTALQPYHQGSIFPCVEVRREYFDGKPEDSFRVHIKPSFSVDTYGAFNSTNLANALSLNQKELKEQYIKMQIKQNYINLLLDYVSNDNCFDQILQELKTKFDIRRYHLKRFPPTT